MNKFWVYILVALILAAHAAFFLVLRMGRDPEKPVPPVSQEANPMPPEAIPQNPPPAPAAATTPAKPASPAATTPAKPASPAVTKTPSSVPSSSSSAKAPSSGGYHRGFFRLAEKPLSAKAKRLVGDVRSGLVIDLDANAILWQKDAAGVHPIASLTKLLTSVMLMEYLESHPKHSLKDRITITASDRKYFKNHGINGVYLDTNESYTLDEMLMCMMVASANDCAYVVGEFIAGGKAEDFPAMMNARAKALGLADMHFNNANGLPVVTANTRSENTGSALDVAYLALRAMRYPEIMKWAKTVSGRIRADKKNPFDVNSTNHLLRDKVPGVTGMKTGYTDGAGYCIVLTCERGGKKRMVVVMGVQGSDRGRHRDEIVKQLLEWSYEQ